MQFLVLGFYKGFGSVYVALQAEYKESDALTGKVYNFNFIIQLNVIFLVINAKYNTNTTFRR